MSASHQYAFGQFLIKGHTRPSHVHYEISPHASDHLDGGSRHHSQPLKMQTQTAKTVQHMNDVPTTNPSIRKSHRVQPFLPFSCHLRVSKTGRETG